MFERKIVVITGCCGTVGKELIRQLVHNREYMPDRIIGIDNNETNLFFLEQQYESIANINFILCDVRDSRAIENVTKGADVLFHCAAFKHVAMCERRPDQAVATNLTALQNIIDAANANSISKVIFTSSDKAVNPTNVMGTTKLMGERLITAANNNNHGKGSTVFASTRFGNVLGSNGSVIPIFHSQIKGGGPVTLTDPRMTRFIMTVEESVRLLIDSSLMAKGGEVFVTKMPVLLISDLAEVMIECLAPHYGIDPASIEVKEIGIKPGEKLYEELMTEEEVSRSLELEKYFSVLPAFRGLYGEIDYEYDSIVSKEVSNAYNSAKQEVMSKKEIKEFLIENKLLNVVNEFSARYWPGETPAPKN